MFGGGGRGMEIDRNTLNDALMGTTDGGAAVIDKIREALVKGDRVIVNENDGSKSLLQPGDKDKSKFKTTRIAES